MGYRKEATLYKLKFEKYDGLEVTVKSLSVGELMDISSLAVNAAEASDVANSVESSNKMLKSFSDNLVSWNLEDEQGKPVPATLAGVRSQEMPFVMEIVSAWMNQVASVDENLGKKPNTTPNLGSLPMETLNHQS